MGTLPAYMKVHVWVYLNWLITFLIAHLNICYRTLSFNRQAILILLVNFTADLMCSVVALFNLNYIFKIYILNCAITESKLIWILGYPSINLVWLDWTNIIPLTLIIMLAITLTYLIRFYIKTASCIIWKY
jgi:hypothetical protein